MLEQTMHEEIKEDCTEKIARIIALSEHELTAKKESKRMGFGQIFICQIRFIGFRIWLCQLIPFSVGFYLLHGLADSDFITPTRLAKLISLLSVAVAAMVLPFLYRSVRYSMMETESAAWLSGRRLMLIRVLILLAGDTAFLAAVIAWIALRTSMGMRAAIAYVSFPFLLAASILLHLVEKSRLPSLLPRYALLCAGMAVMIPLIYKTSRLIFGELFTSFQLAAAGIFLIIGAVRVFRIMKYSDSTIYA